jgi:hypothetical protein
VEQNLIQLIEESFGSEENPWLSKVELTKAEIRLGKQGIEIEAVRDIYTRRGRRNRMRNYPIKGFESLLKNLDQTGTNKVLIHELIDQSGANYLIFTDFEIDQLIGILKFPQ